MDISPFNVRFNLVILRLSYINMILKGSKFNMVSTFILIKAIREFIVQMNFVNIWNFK